MKLIYICGRAGAGKTYTADYLISILYQNGMLSVKIPCALFFKRFIYKYFGISKNKQFNNLKYTLCNLSEYFIQSFEAFIYESGISLDVCIKDNEYISNIIQVLIDIYNGQKVSENTRLLFQLFGTEFGRALDYDIWVKFLLNELKKFKNIVDYVFIDDYRFKNEYEYVKDNWSYGNLDIYRIGINTPLKKCALNLGISYDKYLGIASHVSEKNVIDLLSQCDYIIDDTSSEIEKRRLYAYIGQ